MKEDHRTPCFQAQDVKDGDKEYIYFMGRWEKGGCKCGKQAIHLDIYSLKEEHYRWTDHCWKEHEKRFRYIRNAHFYQAIASL